ncbi:MAG: acetyl-CoA carboxylase carboxyltransferase subunit alpha [Candidatus Krumholzibacteriota bacterium]|nr:acetyl-CoA carboxylase carboxyltransferase subunit alpha [Candidatus Krumholzibacteriota bacterium]
MPPHDTKILDFERPLADLEKRIADLERDGYDAGSDELRRLRARLAALEKKIFGDLSPWEQVLLARHPLRPTTRGMIAMICDEFRELHGDRLFGDDAAVIAGLSRIGDRRVVVVGHEKGRGTRDRLKRNFGMASPEGFRKALRVMRMAEKFGLPILSIVDTPGAYPGVGAEERGQPRAIADNLESLFGIRTPIVVVILGEGGSGGALALAIGDRILMLEHAIYSVISPEGCAAILWKSREKAPEAAASLRLTSRDCFDLGVVDRIIGEAHGAAHRDPEATAAAVRGAVLEEFDLLDELPPGALLRSREEKFDSMGSFEAE